MADFIQLLLYAGAKKEEFKKCVAEIGRANQKRLSTYLIFACVILATLTAASCVVDGMMKNFLVYAIPFVICLALLIYTTSSPDKIGMELTVCIYVFITTIFAVGIILGTVNSPDHPATTFNVLLVLVPLLFTMRPVKNLANIVFYDTVFLICVSKFKSGPVVTLDRINALVFGFVSIVVSSMLMTTMIENAVVRAKLRTVAESDLNTGLKSRNAYEKHMFEYPMHCTNTLCCVYVDVNGLHELNNTKGHAEGDRMLQIVAQKLQDEFGQEDTYRVGGDEFVAFILDDSHESMQERVNRFMRSVEAEGYSVAVGTATHSAGGIDVAALVKTAEQRMYMAKSEHYRQMPGSRGSEEYR